MVPAKSKKLREGGWKYSREAVGVLLVVVGVVCLVSLASHDAGDATTFGAAGPFHNKLSFVGALLSFWLFETLGAAAFGLPLFFGLWAVFQFRGGVSLGRELRLIVFLAATFAAAAFLGLTASGEGDEVFTAAVARGGAVGLFLRQAVVYAVGRWFGLALVGTAALIAAAWAVAGVSPKALWNVAAAAVGWLVRAPAARPRPPVEDYSPPEAEDDAGETIDGGVLIAEGEGAGPVGKPRPGAGRRGGYRLPSPELLAAPAPPPEDADQEFLRDYKKRLEAALKAYHVTGRVREIRRGPRVSRFEVELSPGQKFGAMKSLEEDLARNIAVPGVTVTSLASKGAVAVDVPNPLATRVGLREILETNAFRKASRRSKLTVAVGRRHDGQIVAADLAKMPHLLVAGATGSGKSIFLNSIVMSLLMLATPDEVQFLIIDPKRVDLAAFAKIPHRRYDRVLIKKADEAVVALKAVVRRMEGRYKLLAAAGVRNIEAYNKLFATAEGRGRLEGLDADSDTEEQGRPLPYLVVVVDELNDLMAREKARKVEEQLVRLAQMARAVGVHLVVATQRPSVDVITGVIKANFPSRIAFKVSSQVDSRTILDRPGAEHLLPEGDMLFLPAGASEPERVQGAFVGDDEIQRVVEFWAEQPKPDNLIPLAAVAEEAYHGASRVEEGDELYADAAAFVVSSQMASASMLQRRFRIGFARAGRLIDLMERRGIVGPSEGSKPRRVLVKSLPASKGRERGGAGAS